MVCNRGCIDACDGCIFTAEHPMPDDDNDTRADKEARW